MAQFHPFEKRALEFIRRHELVRPGSHVLAAVSGGADSVALLNVLVSLRDALGAVQITIIHFDHQLRGDESEEDREYVLLLAGRFGLPFHSRCEDVLGYRKRHKISLEMAARACRHRFFGEALNQFEAHAVALGHTANDQAEEVLLRLIRGTGPSGLSGMLPKRGEKIVRPLLFATRREIVRYLEDIGLSYRTDSSNNEPFCQRNRLRLEILPLLERRFHASAVETISRLARLAQDDEAYWALQVRNVWPSVCLSQTDSEVVLELANLLDLHPALQRRIFRHSIHQIHKGLVGIYAVHIESLSRWIEKGTSGSAVQLPGGIWVLKGAAALLITKRDFRCLRVSFEPCPFIIPQPGEYSFSRFHLRLYFADIATLSGSPPTTQDLIWLDAERLSWPLVVRSWKPGDRFQPLGLRGHKKLQDFFVDAKIPKAERDSVPLLCDQEKICCVMGFRLDERVKVTARTRNVLIVEIRTIERE